ncbi:MAG: caspase family protein [Allosphingosinicella sp.]
MLTLRQRGKARNWYIRGTVAFGGRVFDVQEFSSGTSDKAAAEYLKSQKEQELVEQLMFGPRATAARATVADALSSYLSKPKRPGSSDLLRVCKLNDLIGDMTLADPLAAWRRFQDDYLGGYAPAGQDRYRSVLQSAINVYNARLGLAAVRIPSIPFQNERIRFLSLKDRDRLIASYAPHVRPIATVLACQGPRTQEALQLPWGAGGLDMDQGTIFFSRTKNGFPFPPVPGNLRFCAIGLNDFVAATDGAGSRIVVLDPCRDWPDDPADSTRLASDLDEIAGAQKDWPNLLLAYATSASARAGDGLPGEGSAFSTSLCRNLLDHGLTVDECFRRVAQDVIGRRKQQPWTYSSLSNTLSFTDLPRFRAIQRHPLPNPEQLHLGAWSAADASGNGMFVGLRDSLAWHLDLSGFGRSPCPSSGPLVGAAHFGGSLALAGEEGDLFVGWDGGRKTLDLGVDPTIGIVVAPERDGATHFGRDVVTCLRNSGKQLEVAARHDVGFDVYCCIYLPEGLVLAAGGQGRIVEIDPRRPNGGVREIAPLRQHVNAMAVSPDGSRVFAVGQAGLAVELDRSGKVVAELLDERPLTTAAGFARPYSAARTTRKSGTSSLIPVAFARKCGRR